MSELSLRRATAADVDEVAALVESAYGHYVEELGFRPGPLDWDYAEEITGKETWVVPEEGPVEGLLTLREEPGCLWVDNVAVAPMGQGGGTARRLLEFAEGRAGELGVPELRLFTHIRMTRNRAIYARLGWAEVAEITEHGFTRVVFAKKTPD